MMKIHTVNGYHLAGNDFLTLAINMDDPQDAHWFRPSNDPGLELTAWERAIVWTSPG
jgi:hypothetical protein